MTTAALQLVTFEERPDLREAAGEHCSAGWPEFLLHDAVVNENWSGLYEHFPQFQFALLAPGTEEMIVVGNSIPLAYDGSLSELSDDGVRWALQRGFADRVAGRAPRLQCALQIVIKETWQGKGLAGGAIEEMQRVGAAHGLDTLVAPVRPNLKHRYPLMPMERYVGWRRDDGLPFDPWMRVHARLGARQIRVCPQGLKVTGTIAEWTKWTDMQFPGSGPYIVPGGLVPMEIDCEAGIGNYVEPNVWMVHGPQ